MSAQSVLILDASVVINFLCLDAANLLGAYPAKLFITEHVVAEVSEQYPLQHARLKAALANGLLTVVVVTDLAELELMATLRGGEGKKRLGVGECSAIAVAVSRGFALAVDDKAAIKAARHFSQGLVIHTTQGLVLQLIKAGALDVNAADAMKARWESEFRFRLKFKSFQDLL